MFQPLQQYIRLVRRKVTALPLLQKARRRFPHLYSFILQRFDPGLFVGLPLTLLLVVWGLNLALLSEITENVLEADAIVRLDKAVTRFLFESRSEPFSRFLFLVTSLASREGCFIYGALLTLVLLWLRKWMAVIAFWLMMGGVGLTVTYGKKYIQRERPEAVGYYQENNFSFPSGHATSAMAMYGFLAYILLAHGRNGGNRYRYAGAGAVLILVLVLLIGFSRIYLGVHYLSDVLAGFLLGFLWLLSGISVLEVLAYRLRQKNLKE